jgi:hypothetical protein
VPIKREEAKELSAIAKKAFYHGAAEVEPSLRRNVWRARKKIQET